MLRKKEVYTQVTPIPIHIPRQLCIDILHSHGELITVNPLVLDYKAIKAPRDAEADEFYSTWYEITEKIQYVPGMGRFGAGKISFNGCFHDMPWGLQTHIYAPAGVDMRNKWRVCGNQPGEPVEARELGIGAPADGLYLREDIEIRCNITLVSFVKSQMKAAAKAMVDRFIKKAELLDSGVLSAMMENGRLKTINPADRSDTLRPESARPQSAQYNHPLPPLPGSPGSSAAYQVPRISQSPRLSQFPPPSPGHLSHYSQGSAPPTAELQSQGSAIMELPGDYYHQQSSPGLSNTHPHYSNAPRPESTASAYSDNSPSALNARWSDYQASQFSSRPTSVTSDAGGIRSPGIEQKAFASELPAMQEKDEENNPDHADALKKLEARDSNVPYKYNPADYAQIPPGQFSQR
jgi:hypothetical protein